MRKFCGRTAAVIIGLPLAGVPGCRGVDAYQGQRGDTRATYRYRRLSADLPASARVPAVVAAAEATLRGRGYTVTAAGTTEDNGHVDATPAQAGAFESVRVGVRQSSAGTRIEILVEPAGDQVRSRAILDSILATLGI
jgi:hypothetical protein